MTPDEIRLVGATSNIDDPHHNLRTTLDYPRIAVILVRELVAQIAELVCALREYLRVRSGQ